MNQYLSRSWSSTDCGTPPLGAPATIAGAPGFGTITSAGDPRVIQFGLKVHF